MKDLVKTIVCGIANCYLIKGDKGYILIDTGVNTHREVFFKKLLSRGYLPDNITLAILTHGHHDHAGNAEELQKTYGVKIAMHVADDDMVKNASSRFPLARYFLGKLIRKISIIRYRNVKWNAFRPDIVLEDGQPLQEFGFDAKVIHVPGHTEGSIGILTADGSFFAGDMFMNILRPGLPMFADDFDELEASAASLGQYDIKKIYPGHGRPFDAGKVRNPPFCLKGRNC